jgi:hypothetical protein
MNYIVVSDYYLQEQAVQLEQGVRFEDGDLEPDVIAQLLSIGVVEDTEKKHTPVKHEPKADAKS